MQEFNLFMFIFLTAAVITHSQVVKLSEAQQQQFLDRLNAARFSLKSQVPDMMNLTWNVGMEYLASEWAVGCDFVYPHDGYGATNYGNFDPNVTDINELINMAAATWIKEKASHDATGDWSCLTSEENTCRHYSQIVWKETRRVGCAIARCSFSFVVCGYTPSGNTPGQTPY